jgi:hypothetical protein
MSRQATEPPQPPTNKTDIFIDTDGDLAYKRPDGSVGKLKGGGTANLAGYNLTLGADVLLAGSVAGGGTVSVPTGHTAAFARGGTPMVRGSNHAAGRVPVFSTNTDVLDGDAGLSYDAANDLLSVGTGVVGAQMRLVEQGSSPAQVSGHTVVFVDSNGDLCWRKDDGSVVKLAAAGTYTLTVPATGTAALRDVANTFSQPQTFSQALTAPGMKPASDTTTAIQLQRANGAAVLTVDTINDNVIAANDIVATNLIRGSNVAVRRVPVSLDRAVGVWKFDGPAPYSTDYSGSNVSHAGLAGTTSGHMIYRPGKFGKAIQFGQNTTNSVLNPSAEGSGNYSALGAATCTIVNTAALYGNNSYQIATTAAVGDGISITLNALSNAVHSVSFYSLSNLNTLQISLDGGANWNNISCTRAPEPNWYRYTLANVPAAQANGSTALRIRQSDATSRTFLIDAVQVEQKEFVSSYHDGSLTTPSSWNGTAHSSSSTRTGNGLTYTNPVNTEEGTAIMWVYAEDVSTNSSGLFMAGTPYLDAYLSGNSYQVIFRQGSVALTGTQIAIRDWVHLAFTWSKFANVRRIFVNGVQVASRQYDDATTPTTTMRLGGLSSNSLYNLNGLLDEFVLFDYAVDPKMIRAIYESNAPVIAPAPIGASLTAANNGSLSSSDATIIANMRTRINELESRLKSVGMLV